MKLTILLSFFAFTANAQSIKKYITMYEEYCNELVPDTVIQYGKVTKECYPVYDKDNVLTSYFCVNKDTTWLPVKCKPFKNDNRIWIGSTSGVVSPSMLTDNQYWGTWGSGITLGERREILNVIANSPTESEITRQHVCMVKRQSVEPFSWDFWNFIKTH